MLTVPLSHSLVLGAILCSISVVGPAGARGTTAPARSSSRDVSEDTWEAASASSAAVEIAASAEAARASRFTAAESIRFALPARA